MTGKLYIPITKTIGEPPVPAPVPVPAEQEADLNVQEREILNLLMSHPGQRRGNIRCDAKLSAAARFKSEEMAQLGYFSHESTTGEWPNQLVVRFGCVLPVHYPDAGNSIESIAAGHVRGVDAWSGWLASEGHRIHLLGLNSFFAEQVMVGIGYHFLESSPYQRYWVILSAPEQT